MTWLNNWTEAKVQRLISRYRLHGGLSCGPSARCNIARSEANWRGTRATATAEKVFWWRIESVLRRAEDGKY